MPYPAQEATFYLKTQTGVVSVHVRSMTDPWNSRRKPPNTPSSSCHGGQQWPPDGAAGRK